MGQQPSRHQSNRPTFMDPIFSRDKPRKGQQRLRIITFQENLKIVKFCVHNIWRVVLNDITVMMELPIQGSPTTRIKLFEFWIFVTHESNIRFCSKHHCLLVLSHLYSLKATYTKSGRDKLCHLSWTDLQTQKPNITQLYLFLLRDIITQNVSKEWDSFTV